MKREIHRDKCEVSWCTNGRQGTRWCPTHQYHMRVYGEIRRTRSAPNEIAVMAHLAWVILYDVSGRPTHKVLIDADMVDWVRGYRWHPNPIRGHIYAYTYIGPRHVGMHRLVTSVVGIPGIEVDHINGDTLDNRRSNLRTVPHAENMRNIHSSSGCSRYRGVARASRGSGKWRAYARCGGKQVYLGRFDSEQEAALAAAQWRKRHWPTSFEPLLGDRV